MSLKSINPFNYVLNEEFQEHGDEEIKSTLALSEAAFCTWKNTSFSFRSFLFLNCAKLLMEQKESLAAIITREMGKVNKEAIAEIEKCAKTCEYYASNAEVFLKDEIIESAASKSYVSYEPVGCIFAIMPWNFPFWQVFRFAIPALMAGNVGLLKLASNVPQCALAIEKVLKEAGFPAGVFQTILIGSHKVEQIISHKTIKAVTLTGSEKAGSEVASVAGKNIKKTVLELGGSDAFIVLEDADLEYATTMAVKSRMQNAGQSCIAAKRFIVAENVFDEFLEKFKLKIAAIRLGDPMDANSDMGPMARKDLVESLVEQVQKSVDRGASLLVGGKPKLEKGAFISPGILINVAPGMPAYEEELFGPIASVIKVKDADQAVLIANDSRYGLGASVWTKDVNKAAELARKIESGAVFINGMVASDPHLPFGGIKFSGYGRELSYHGIREFVNIKTVWIA